MSFSCFQIFMLSEPRLPVRTCLSCREPLFVSDYQVCDLRYIDNAMANNDELTTRQVNTLA